MKRGFSQLLHYIQKKIEDRTDGIDGKESPKHDSHIQVTEWLHIFDFGCLSYQVWSSVSSLIQVVVLGMLS